MKLLVDMNLSPHWVQVLASAGFDALHWSAAGRHNATDAEIAAFAKTHDYVLLTQDLDFGEILIATQGTKPSVVQVRSDVLHPDSIQVQVVLALNQMHDELERGALLSIDPGGTRLRLLPLKPSPSQT